MTKQDAIQKAVEAYDTHSRSQYVIRRGDDYKVIDSFALQPIGYVVAEMIGPGNVHNYRPMPWCESCESYHAPTAPGCFKGTERDKAKMWDSPPVRCPYCGGVKLTELMQWAAISEEDKDNSATLVEWQCMGICEGRSFYV